VSLPLGTHYRPIETQRAPEPPAARRRDRPLQERRPGRHPNADPASIGVRETPLPNRPPRIHRPPPLGGLTGHSLPIKVLAAISVFRANGHALVRRIRGRLRKFR